MSAVINRIKPYTGMAILAGIIIILTVTFGIYVPLFGLGLSLVLIFFYKMIKDLRWGFYLLMAANFFSVGLTRYVSLPLGLLIDSILLLLFVVFFLKKFKNISWKPLANPVFIVVSIWMLINIFEILNPQAISIEAWFYAMRGVVLYFFLTLLIAYLCLDQKKDFNWFIYLWFLFSIIGTFWGIKQLFIGLDSAEKAWLNVPGNLSTHLLFGRLRVFSFYSDAGQFGASQAHTALVASILALSSRKTAEKIFFIITAVLCFYGMLISGTRGAFAIPIIGFLTYLILIRNFKIVVIGASALAILFVLLKFTFIGQGNYQIQRLRSSLDPNDASLQVRIANQKNWLFT